jgi:hypothetical protein
MKKVIKTGIKVAGQERDGREEREKSDFSKAKREKSKAKSATVGKSRRKSRRPLN